MAKMRGMSEREMARRLFLLIRAARGQPQLKILFYKEKGRFADTCFCGSQSNLCCGVPVAYQTFNITVSSSQWRDLRFRSEKVGAMREQVGLGVKWRRPGLKE